MSDKNSTSNEKPDDIAEKQAQLYSYAIGRALPQDKVDDVTQFAKDAPPKHVYTFFPDEPFVFEVLEKEGWNAKVGELARLWVENEANVQRAATCVQREIKPHKDGLLRRFGIFRLKEHSVGKWASVRGGLGLPRETDPLTVIFIALGNLNPDNGFFISLLPGQDVCLDTNADIKFPPSGGGMGIFLFLRL